MAAVTRNLAVTVSEAVKANKFGPGAASVEPAVAPSVEATQ
jgi:hypothetical protein